MITVYTIEFMGEIKNHEFCHAHDERVFPSSNTRDR